MDSKPTFKDHINSFCTKAQCISKNCSITFIEIRKSICNIPIWILNILQDRLNTSIEASKQKCYCRMTNKLTNAQKSSKTYWSLLKGFLNNKKIPHILPLFHENCFIIDFEKRQNFLTLPLLNNAPYKETIVNYQPV